MEALAAAIATALVELVADGLHELSPEEQHKRAFATVRDILAKAPTVQPVGPRADSIEAAAHAALAAHHEKAR